MRYLATAQRLAGALAPASKTADAALGRALALGLREDAARCRALLATILAESGSATSAAALLRECVRDCDAGAVTDPEFSLRVTWDLAMLLDAQGDREGARPHVDRALRLAAALATPEARSATYAETADERVRRGEPLAADHFAQKSVFVHEESRLIGALRAMLESAGSFYEPEGDAEQLRRARELLEELR